MRRHEPRHPDRWKRLLRAAAAALPERRQAAYDAFHATGGVHTSSAGYDVRLRTQRRLEHASERRTEAALTLYRLAQELVDAAARHNPPDQPPEIGIPEPPRLITKTDVGRTSQWWRGKTLIVRRPISTVHSRIQTGRPVTVLRKYKGLEIRTNYCVHCGTAWHDRQVPFSSLAWPPEKDD